VRADDQIQQVGWRCDRNADYQGNVQWPNIGHFHTNEAKHYGSQIHPGAVPHVAMTNRSESGRFRRNQAQDKGGPLEKKGKSALKESYDPKGVNRRSRAPTREGRKKETLEKKEGALNRPEKQLNRLTWL